jgi:hypothetical protein
MSFESVMGVSPDVMLELMFGMGMVGIIWMLLLSVALSIPPILVLISKRSQGWAKFAWFMLASVFSWLGYVAFLIFTKPVRDKATDDAPTPGGS